MEPDELRRRLAQLPDPLALLEGIFASSPIAFQIYGADGRSLLTSPAFERLFGVEPPPAYNVFEDEVAAARGILDMIRRAFAGETVHIPPIWYDPRDLEHVHIEQANRVALASTAFPLFDGEGAVAYVVIVVEDLTVQMEAREVAEARRAEAELAVAQKDRSLALLDTLMATAPVGLGFVDPELRHVRVNEALAGFLGAAPAEVLGRALGELDPRLGGVLEPIYRRVLETGEPGGEIELTGEAGAGSRQHWIVESYPVRTPSGDTLGVGVVVHDITGRKRLEQALGFLAEAGAMLVASLDLEGTCANVARFAASKLADWCAVHLVAEGEPARVSVAHRDPSRCGLVEALEAHPPTSPHPLGEVLWSGRPILLPTARQAVEQLGAGDALRLGILGALGLASAMVVPIRGRAGVIGAIVFGSAGRCYGPGDLALAEEFASRAGLALDNARFYEEARRAVQTRQDVLAIVSHDLKNPLGTMIISAELISRHPADVEQVRRDALAIRRAGAQMARLVRDLLDASSIEAGRLAVDLRLLDVKEVLDGVAPLLGPKAEEAGVRLEVVPGDGVVLADSDRVLQVLSNLVGNAVKFTPAGGTVRVWTEIEPGAVRFSVRDTGKGIPPEEQAHVFDRYWRTRTEREGAGLGLFISRGIVEAHGGRLWVESGPDPGSTFSFTLPAPPPVGG